MREVISTKIISSFLRMQNDKLSSKWGLTPQLSSIINYDAENIWIVKKIIEIFLSKLFNISGNFRQYCRKFPSGKIPKCGHGNFRKFPMEIFGNIPGNFRLANPILSRYHHVWPCDITYDIYLFRLVNRIL